MTTSIFDYRDYSLADLMQMRAATFIKQHSGAYLRREDLIQQSIEQLVARYDCSNQTAERATVRALSEYESRSTRAYIALDESTAYHVAVRDPATKALRIFTVADLMRLVGTPDLTAMPTPSKRAACAGQSL